MGVWWNNLSLTSQIFYCIAIAATAVLVIQTILLLFGIGDGDVDADISLDADGSDVGDIPGDGFNLFTLRGIVAFFTVGGWTGVVLSEFGKPLWLVLLLSILLGVIGMVAVALVFKLFSKLQNDGTLDMQNAIGKSAVVYVPVRAGGDAGGKVTMTLQGRFMELDAVTDDAYDYTAGEPVEVVGLRNDAVVVTRQNPDHLDAPKK